MSKRTKNNNAAVGNDLRNVDEAIKLVKANANAKFDETVEVAFRLNIDTKHADQQIRGAMVLPHGSGKSQSVLVLTSTDQAKLATEAGADYVGAQDMINKIKDENWFDFDVIIATPEMMPILAPLGRALGPKGLMPNPKTGTVTTDVVKAVNEVKAGKIEYRAEKTGIIHAVIGKASFTQEQLVGNYKALLEVVLAAKPSAVKGKYVKSVGLTSTMGPGVKLDVSDLV